MTSKWDKVLRQVDDYRWEVPQDYKDGMRVPGLIYADDLLISSIINDQALEQVANVAFLPGIVYASMAMPDIHWGYGFPVGGVAATKVDGGVISPGGVGFGESGDLALQVLTFIAVKPRFISNNRSRQRVVVGQGGPIRKMSQVQYEQIPETLTLRELRFDVTVPGH
ncbi:MAG: RtcB family protein, partial [Dehalococcoidia bacterium]